MLILASNSPRRKELLEMLGYDFIVRASDCDETTEIKNPNELVKELSLRKALSVTHNENDVIIGSDTVVAINNKILGKPKDKKDAENMLKLLSGNSHTVYTGVTVIKGDLIITECIDCDVYFKPLSQKEIDVYIATGEPMDKAGAYAIQGKGSAFIEKINGDYFTVVGLPCCYLNGVLNSLGLFPTFNA